MKKENESDKKKKSKNDPKMEDWNIGNYGSREGSEKAIAKKDKPSKK